MNAPIKILVTGCNGRMGKAIIDCAPNHDLIKITEKIKLDNSMFDISLIYENEPIKLRRLEIISDDENIQMGFFTNGESTQLWIVDLQIPIALEI